MAAIEKYSLESFRASRKGKVFCFVTISNDYKVPRWSIGIATLGEAGYMALSPKLGAEDDWKTMDAVVDTMNDRLGLSVDTCIAIVADTMNRSNHHRDMEEGITNLRVREDDLKYLKKVVGDDVDCWLASAKYQSLLDRISDMLDNYQLR